MSEFFNRPALPIIPGEVLDRFRVNDIKDTRFASCARLRQSLWRQERQFPVGEFIDDAGVVRQLGNLLSVPVALKGANFLSPEIARLVRRDVAYREVGALIDEKRLWCNLLSSQPLTYNLFGPLKLDLKLATEFFRAIFPDFVSSVADIAFEHAPGRGKAAFTADYTAFDAAVAVHTPRGHVGVIVIEIKYSESLRSCPTPTNPRHDAIAAASGLFRDHAAPQLRQAPMQQLWREHLLSRAMLGNGLPWQDVRFAVISPALNIEAGRAIDLYESHLVDADPGRTGFQRVGLETCVSTLAEVGCEAVAAHMRERYLDFSPIESFIVDWEPEPLPALS